MVRDSQHLCARVLGYSMLALASRLKLIGETTLCSQAFSAMPFKVPTPLSQASGEKRSADGANPSQAKKAKLPPLSELVQMESAPKRANAQRLPAIAPLNVCIYKARQLLPLSVWLVGC